MCGVCLCTLIHNCVWFEDQYGRKLVTGTNAGMGGVTSHYMSVCSSLHVPAHSDIIIVEFSINDNPSFQLTLDAKK